MRTVITSLTLLLLGASLAMPQGRPIDWPSAGGDARRTGWEKSDVRITKENAKNIVPVLRRKLDHGQTGVRTLSPPIVLGLLISYKGFKELGFVSSSSGNVWAIDLDLNRVFWQKNVGAAAGGGTSCSAATAPALIPPAVFGGRRPAAAKPTTPAPRLTVGSRPMFAAGADGQLHQLNTSDGSDQFPALPFLPTTARASALTIHDGVVYATTNGCGSTPAGVWAIDLRAADPKPVNFSLNGGTPGGLTGFALGDDGTVFVQTAPGGAGGNTLYSLAARDLAVKGAFSLDAPAAKTAPGINAATPVVFTYKERELVASAGADGRIYLHEAAKLGGEDHKTFLSRTAPLGTAKGGIWGGLSSWEDADGTRWVAAPVWGGLNADLKVAASNGSTPNGAIVAFKVQDENGAPSLVPAWSSRDLTSPVPPVITTGVVFALSTTGKAILYALDSATGKELYSTGNQVTVPATLTGLTVANGRVFFTTTDNTLYGFGIFMEI